MEKIFKSGKWIAFERALRIANGLFISASIAKMLGPSDYGQYALAIGWVYIFVAFSEMGAEYINQSVLFSNDDSTVRFFCTALFARLIFLVFPISAYLLVSGYYGNPRFLVLIPLIALSPFSLFGQKIQATGKFSLFSKINCLSLLLGAILRFVGLFYSWGVSYFFWTLVIEYSFLIVMEIALSKSVKNTVKAVRYFNLKELQDYLLLCLPAAFSTLLLGLYARVELIAVSAILGPKEVGYWGVVSMTLSPWTMVAVAMLPITNHRLLQKFGNKNEYETMKSSMLRIYILIGVGASICNVIAVAFLLPHFFGNKYSSAMLPAIIASFSLISLFVNAFQNLTVAHDKTPNVLLLKIVWGLPVAISGLYFFSKMYGLTGVAISMVLSGLWANILVNFIVDKRFFRLLCRSVSVAR